MSDDENDPTDPTDVVDTHRRPHLKVGEFVKFVDTATAKVKGKSRKAAVFQTPDFDLSTNVRNAAALYFVPKIFVWEPSNYDLDVKCPGIFNVNHFLGCPYQAGSITYRRILGEITFALILEVQSLSGDGCCAAKKRDAATMTSLTLSGQGWFYCKECGLR